MIKITSLNKIYKSKKRRKCHALKDINLTLPDSGLVFVLGKSGSGKSTLLNLIGGLDNITSGSIEVDGNDLARFREKDFCNYRNTHIGFIFQDYHLIDELTVYENIALSLNLRRLEDKEEVKNALARVDLAGYEERYPSELSGGEQQRVAIARAIVKKPRIILADEPTGNLDTNTAKAIVELLKELSQECLILIVSHNVNDANNYADRIIELKKGEIISDKSRNPEFPDGIVLQNNTLIYPDGTTLNDNDIELLNANPAKKVIKKTDKFLSTKEPKGEGKKVKIENKNLTFAKETRLSGKFLKNKVFAIAASSIMVSAIMVIMALAQTIIAFDGGRIVAEEMSKSEQTSLLLNKVVDDETKARLDGNYRVKIDDGDIQAFYDAGYKGKIYPVLNYCIPVANMGVYYGTGGSTFYNGLHLASTFGTMVVDEDFLERKFGDYEFAAEAEVKVNYGVYITDYVADSLIAINTKYKNKSYDDVIGEFYLPAYNSPRLYINGIIKTDYKEKYGELIEEVIKGNITSSEMYENPECQKFLTDIYDCLGYSYSTNSEFVNAYKNSNIAVHHPGHYKLNFNGIKDITTAKSPYLVGFNYFPNITESPNFLGNIWLYTKETPEIPEGAKYMRVSFNDGIDERFGIKNDLTTREYALLRFDDNEPISKDIMNYHRGTKEQGVALNGYNGALEYVTQGLQYSLVSDYIEIPEGAEITEFASISGNSVSCFSSAYCVFYDENKEFIASEVVWHGVPMEESTIKLNYEVYNEIFGTSYDKTNLDTFIPHKSILAHYEYSDLNNENPLFKKEVTIVGLMDSSITMFVSDDISQLFLDDFVRGQALYFDGTDGIGAVLDTAETLNYEAQSYAVEGIHTMTKVVDVFVPIFEIIALFLCAAVVFILVNFSSKMIKDKMHEIGILKALGTKNSTIVAVFGLQVVLIAILTCVLSTVGYYFLVGVANDVLFESMKQFVKSRVVLDLDFFTFMPKIALEDCALVAALSAISMIIPMIKIKAIKPVKIIKAKE